MKEVDFEKKIKLFSDMDGWEKMKESMTDIPEDQREAELMKFIDAICGMNI